MTTELPDDPYVVPPQAPVSGAGRPAVDGERIRQRMADDLEAGTLLDPLDMLDDHAVSLLWTAEGARLLRREDEVHSAAETAGWGFAPLDAALSARLVEGDVLAGCPRVTRNVCRPSTADDPLVCDLTGATFHQDGAEPVHLHLRAATLGLVGFPSDRRLAVVPTGADPSGWRRFGDGFATESPAFDSAYRVHADDDSWGRVVLNPAVMARLVDRYPLTLVVAGGAFAAIMPGYVPGAALKGFQRLTNELALSAGAARSD